MNTPPTGEPIGPRKCTAHKSTNGEPCGNPPIKGGTVCRYHGGSAPQVREAAATRWAERLDREIDPSLDKVAALRDGGKDERVQLAAAKDLLDRGGVRVGEGEGVTVDVTIRWPE